MRIESATGSGATVNAPARQNSHGPRADRHGSHGPRTDRHGSGGPRQSREASGRGSNGLHLGQIKKMVSQAESGSGSLDMEALQGLTSRLNDVMDRLDSLTGVVGQAVTSATTSQTPTPAPAPAPTGTAATSSGATATAGGGAGGAGGTGGTGAASSTASPTINLAFPFQGPTDFGSITINGVTTDFGVVDAQGGLSSNQVAGSLVNIINSNPDNTVTAQQRDNKIMLVSKTAGEAISVDAISLGSTSGTLSGFAGFLDGMSGTGTLLSNPISPIRR